MTQEQICMVPRLKGLGGMVSFQARLEAGLAQRGVTVTYDLADPANRAILVIGGTRQVAALVRARQRGVRIVQRLNGMNWIHLKQKTPLRSFLRAEGNNLLLAAIRRQLAQHIVYQSQFSKQWWERIYGPLAKSCQVTYNGVDLNSYSSIAAGGESPPTDHYRLLLVEGHLGPGNTQGLENAIKLAEGLQTKISRPVELMVAGDVPAALRALWPTGAGKDNNPAALNAHKRSFVLNWAGIISREAIPALDRSAHLLFSADLNAACPNAVIEALACGLPVAAFDTGALAEIVTGDAGRVVPYGGNHWKLELPQIPPLVDAAADILEENERFRQGARSRACSAFGLETMVDRYLEALTGKL
jgi:glycosyltransferase involved in cell wall biosynthesis